MKYFSILIILASLTFACKSKKTITNSTTQSSSTEAGNTLIRDCPEELIVNSMPSTDTKKGGKRNSYYIYKGERKEINEFDTVWVKKNCSVPVTNVK